MVIKIILRLHLLLLSHDTAPLPPFPLLHLAAHIGVSLSTWCGTWIEEMMKSDNNVSTTTSTCASFTAKESVVVNQCFSLVMAAIPLLEYLLSLESTLQNKSWGAIGLPNNFLLHFRTLVSQQLPTALRMLLHSPQPFPPCYPV